jgi:ABC transporter substrate-binding protein (ThiB subfamily)
VTVTRGWSESYGMFTDGEVDMVLSYTTSPAYHIVAEENDRIAAAIFPEGHYFMAEVAGVLAGAAEPELARDFMAYILSEEFQTDDRDRELVLSVGPAARGLARGVPRPAAARDGALPARG